jgi:hypothetical protein
MQTLQVRSISRTRRSYSILSGLSWSRARAPAAKRVRTHALSRERLTSIHSAPGQVPRSRLQLGNIIMHDAPQRHRMVMSAYPRHHPLSHIPRRLVRNLVCQAPAAQSACITRRRRATQCYAHNMRGHRCNARMARIVIHCRHTWTTLAAITRWSLRVSLSGLKVVIRRLSAHDTALAPNACMPIRPHYL